MNNEKILNAKYAIFILKIAFQKFPFFLFVGAEGGCAIRSGTWPDVAGRGRTLPDEAGRGRTRPDEAGRGRTLPLRGSVRKLGILKVSVKQQRSVLRAASENLIKLSFPPHAFDIVCARYAQQC